MTIHATMNLVGSTNPKDLIDNAQNLDWLILGPLLGYPDRLGVNRLSWAGIEAAFAAAQAARASEYSSDKLARDTEFAEDQAERIAEFDADQDNRVVQFNAFMDASGYEPPIAYAAGILLDRTTKTVSYLGNEYRAKGSFIPFTTSNWATDAAKLKLIGDDSLRQDLANPADPSEGMGMLAFTRTALVDAVSSASRMLSAQKVNVWEYQHLVTSKPTMDPNTWNWTQPQLAAITECKKVPNKALVYPAGKYLTETTLDFGSLSVEGTGTDAGVGTEIQALTDGMLLAKVGSGCFITNLKFNGKNKAIWNVLISGNRPTMIRVESTYAKEFGFVFNGTQNGSFYSLVSYFCLYSFGLFNGTRNCIFFSCGSATSSGPTGVRDPNQVEIVSDFNTSNPYGFGLLTTITTNGNDRNSFFGGIFEYPDTIISLRNTANTNKDVGRLFFYGSEFAGSGKILDTAGLTANSNPKLIFDNCEFTWKDQVTPFSAGARGELTFQGHASFSGGGQLVNRGITQVNNLDTAGVRTQDGTVYVDAALNVTTIPKNGFYRPVASGSISEAVSFGTGHKETWFSQPAGAAFVGGTTYRTVKGSMAEPLTYALTAGLNKVGAYAPTGVGSLPEGVAQLVENVGNGASDSALVGFRVRADGSNNYGYIGIINAGLVFGVRNNSGGGYSERLSINKTGHILPGVDNVQNLGSATLRIGTIYTGTNPIVSSDGNLKQQVRTLHDSELAVARAIKGLIRAYKFNDAVEAKGDGARIHFGVIAQEVAAAFEAEGLDPDHYGIFCHDVWEDEYVDVCEDVPIEIDGVPLLDGNGNPCTEGAPTGERVLVREGGSRYGIRYDQLAMFMIASI